MTTVALDASTDMPPWTPSAVIPVPIGLLIWAEDLPRIVWRGHHGSPMVPVDGVLWEQSGGWIEFIVLTRTDRAITEGITTRGARRSSPCTPCWSRPTLSSPTTTTVTRPG